MAAMTEKQAQFIKSLLSEREGNESAEAIRDALNQAKRDRPEDMTTRYGSDTIEQLLAIPANKPQPLEDGMYSTKGKIYKVYHTIHGANVQVAKELVMSSDGGAEFQYRGRRPLWHIRPEDALSLDEAKRLGQIYGVCCVCGRDLTDEDSIKAGIGPVCATRF